jgi:NADH dehydrogenase
VIVAAGFGGLFASRAPRRAPAGATVIARTDHHLFRPLLHQAATGVLSFGDIAPATRDVLRQHENTRVLLGEVVARGVDAGTNSSSGKSSALSSQGVCERSRDAGSTARRHRHEPLRRVPEFVDRQFG